MADFKFYLSRQGPKGEPGAKGEKGDNGNTPVFSDGINTPTVYTMQIDMGDGNVFETQNLKYPMRDDGGNYLRYDRTDSTVTLSAPNIADLQRTMGEVTLASVSDVENEDAQDTDAVSMELRNADQLALGNEINRIDRDINTVDDKVDREIQNRQDADTQLTNKINTDVGNEATSRSNADTALSGRIDGLDSSKANKSDVYTKTQTDTLLSEKANTVHTHTLSQITNAGSLASKNTVDYSTEVTNKPTIGNGTITITQGGVTKGTFTTNQSGDSTVALDAGGGGVSFEPGTGLELTQQNVLNVKIDGTTITTNASGELVASGGGSSYTPGDGINITNSVISVKVDNDSIYVNQDGELVANLEDIEDALEAILGGDASIFSDYYTKTQSDSRYMPITTLATVATSGNYNDLSNKPTIPSTANMVTTDTNQTITGSKSFQNIGLSSSGVYMGLGYMNSNIGCNQLRLRYDTGVKIELMNYYNESDIEFTGDNKLILKPYNADKVYKDSGNNFLIDKDLLDGTTIQYNTTSGKVEVIGGGGTSSELELALGDQGFDIKTIGDAEINGETLSVPYLYGSYSAPNNFGYVQVPATSYLYFRASMNRLDYDSRDTGICGFGNTITTIDAADSLFIDRYSGGRFTPNCYSTIYSLSGMSDSGNLYYDLIYDNGSISFIRYTDDTFTTVSSTSTFSATPTTYSYIILGCRSALTNSSACTFDLTKCFYKTAATDALTPLSKNMVTINRLDDASFSVTDGKLSVIGGGGTPTQNFTQYGGIGVGQDCIFSTFYPGYINRPSITLNTAGEFIFQIECVYTGERFNDEPIMYELQEVGSSNLLYLNGSSIRTWDGSSESILSSVDISRTGSSQTYYNTSRFIHRLEVSNSQVVIKTKYSVDANFTTVGTYSIPGFTSDEIALSILGGTWYGRACKGVVYTENTFVADGNGNILWKPLG